MTGSPPQENIPDGESAVAAVIAKLSIGQKMSDGSIYLGYYNKKDWFVAAEDAKNAKGIKLEMTFNQAASYAKNLRAHGHDDWMLPPGVPDQNEPTNILNEMFNNKSVGAFKNTYNETDSDYGRYWSSREARMVVGVWEQRFNDGGGGWGDYDDTVSVRAVRAVPRP